MTPGFKEAITCLTGAAAQFGKNELAPVPYRDIREQALATALVELAKEHGIALQTPLQVNSLGEFSIVALHPEGPLLTRGCGHFNEIFAAALTAHKARTGTAAGTICPENGWCYLNHFEAEALVLERFNSGRWAAAAVQ